MLCTVAGASLFLGKGHCYTLSAFDMQQFSIRNALSLGFAAFWVSVVPPNGGHVLGAVTSF